MKEGRGRRERGVKRRVILKREKKRKEEWKEDANEARNIKKGEDVKG